MQSPNKNSKHSGIARLRELGAITLMLVSMSLISSCGGGGGGGDNAESGNEGGRVAPSKQATPVAVVAGTVAIRVVPRALTGRRSPT